MNYIDPAKASPENYKVLFENEHVIVLEMSLKAGQQDHEHSHHDETVYFVSGGKVKIHLPDGQLVEADLPDGHIMWHEAWTHTVENVGESDIRAIISREQAQQLGLVHLPFAALSWVSSGWATGSTAERGYCRSAMMLRAAHDKHCA